MRIKHFVSTAVAVAALFSFAPSAFAQHDAVMPRTGMSEPGLVSPQHDATMPREYPAGEADVVVTSNPQDGFDWISAAIGGSLAIALLLGVGFVYTGVSRRRTRSALA